MDIEIFFGDEYSKFTSKEYAQPIFLPKTQEMNVTMELEYKYTNSIEMQENLDLAPKDMASRLLLSNNHSKDSLKFARRVAKYFLEIIRQDSNQVVEGFLGTGIKILESQMSIFDLKIFNSAKLIKASLGIIELAWIFFAKSLSCSYNKKISKVTSKIWGMVFTEEGFWKCVNENRNNLELKDYLIGEGKIDVSIAKGFYKKVLFLVNRGLVLFHLMNLKEKSKILYDNIPTFDNYIVLGMVPELYDFYNHKRGVFVNECCRSCKVCQSKSMDKSIVLKIKTAWDYAVAFKESFASETGVQSFADPLKPLKIINFLTILDDAITSLNF